MAIGIAVIALTVLAFAAMGIWMAVRGTKPQLPAGDTTLLSVFNAKLHLERGFSVANVGNLMHGTGLDWDEMKTDATAALLEVSKAWGVYRGVSPVKALDGVIILVLGDVQWKEALASNSLQDNTVAFQSYATQSVGTGPLMLCIKGSAGPIGELVVHEAAHALLTVAKASTSDNNLHEDPNVWSEGGIEQTAVARFRERRVS